MVQALKIGGLSGAVVFMGGVLFGWEYALMLGLTVLLALSLINMVVRRKQ